MMEPRTVNTVKIFLASSSELHDDRVAFAYFINTLRQHYKPRGFDFELIEWEFLGLDDHTARMQDKYNEHIKNCDIFISLFHTKAGEYTIEEFETALIENKKRGLPMLTFMRELTDGKEADDSLKNFQKDYLKDYFWSSYANIEKLHLDFTLWLDDYLMANSTFSVKDGVITLGDVPVADISQQPFAANNQEYLSLVDQLQKLETDIEQLRDNMAKYPDDFTFPETLSKKLLEKARCQEELARQQEALLGAAKRIVEIEKQQVGKKLQNAIEAFNNGQLERANTLLDQIAQEGASHIERLEQDKDLVHQDIEALQLQTQTVMAKVETPIEERRARVAEIYAKADDWASRSAYEKEKYAKLLFDYAQFHCKYGPYQEAERICLRQITMSEELYGTDHPDTATSYNNIGTVYYNLGNYDKALEYHQKALKIYEKKLGIDHPDTAIDYNNIGAVYDSQGFYGKALEYYQKALEIKKKVLGTDHPFTATSYNNIGMVYNHQGNYDKALEYHQKALEIRVIVLGNDHPDTAQSYNNIGFVYNHQGNNGKALEYYQKALEIRKKVLGTDHPDTAQSYNNIGDVFRNQGNYDKAFECHQKALEIREKVLGNDHPDTAQSYNNIGTVYYHQGNYDNALKYYQKALEIREKILGTDHPSTAGFYNNIGDVFRNQGNYGKALEYHQKALEIRKKSLGTDHPDTAESYNNIGTVYYHQGNYTKALEFFGKALDIFKIVLGVNHPNTKTSQRNIDILKENMKK